MSIKDVSSSVVLFAMLVLSGGMKIWLPDLNFENPENWTPNRVPCHSDRIVYPRKMNAVVELTAKNILIRAIVLPMDGKIQLKNDGVVALLDGEYNMEGCPGEDIYFKTKIIARWMDTNNWKDSNPQPNKEAIPHYDRLPCFYEVAYFPPDKSIVVELPLLTEYVGGIQYKEVYAQTNREINDLFTQYQSIFQRPLSGESEPVAFLPGSNECLKDDVDCPCHMHRLPLQMCEIHRCPAVKCRNPVRPRNHCCNICGSILLLQFDENIQFKTIKSDIEKSITEYGMDNFIWHASLLHKKNVMIVQLVIMEEEEYDGRSEKLAKYIESQMNKDEYSVRNITLRISGIPWAGPNAPIEGWEAIVMCVIMVLLLTGVALYYYPPAFIARVNPFRAYDFARFDNRSREGSLVLGVSHLSLDKAFDNPMYRKSHRTSEDEFDMKKESLKEAETDEEYDDISHLDDTNQENE